MARIKESVEISRPVEKVFAYTTEAKSWPKWQSFIKEAEQTSQGPWSVGTTTKGVTRMMGLSMNWTAKVTENEPNRMWTKNITSGGMNIAEQVTYAPIAEGIKFTIAYDIKASGFMKLFSPMVASSMRKGAIKSLNTLKTILEAQA